MSQRRPAPIAAGKIKPISIDLFRIVWLLLRQRAHLRIGLGVLSGLPQIA